MKPTSLTEKDVPLYSQDQVVQIVEIAIQSLQRRGEQSNPRVNLDNEIAQIDMSPGTKQTLTVSEAAEILGVSKPMVYSLIRDGSIPAINVGKKILISKLVLAVWLKNGGHYGEETCEWRRKYL